ncbi:hypothetical protein QE430_000201 [Microbacterium testaceum]|nr:hypothetical protein [Microbacterium testaceum]
MNGRMRGVIGATLALLGVVILTACGSGYRYAWGVSEDELVGVWHAPHPGGTELTLADDGTFVASAWPRNLDCQGTRAESLDELDIRSGEGASGVWDFSPGSGDDTSGGLIPTLTLTFSEICFQRPQAVLTSYHGAVGVCFPLDDDPDSFTSSRMFALLPEGADGDMELC